MKKPLLISCKSLCLSLGLMVSSAINATAYYFSTTNGDDSRSSTLAQNAATPWRSLAKLNSIFATLRPGDSILFRRGEVFEGAIVPKASGSATAPIVLAAYGTGTQPVISGLTTFSGWAQAGTNIWETDASRAGSEMNIVLINGSFQAIGRYPNNNAANAGYLNIDSYTDKTSITSSSLGGATNWTGGEVVIRKNRWILDRNLITGHSGTTVYYNSGSGYYPNNNYGYFIQNHPNTLDQNGEWYFRNKRLGIFASTTPTSLSVQGSVVPVLVNISGVRYLVFSGLSFVGANTNAFEIRNAQNISISNCSVLYSGMNAFSVFSSDALNIEGSTIDYSNNLAMNLNCSNTVIRNNVVKRSGSIAGMGRSGDGTYTGILFLGNNNQLEGNTIEQTGYVPVSFNGSSVTIKNNFINQFSLVKDDGGGIYTWNNSSNAPTYTNRKITGNIVLNGRSAIESTKEKDKKFAHGIYIDDNATNVEVVGNTVANCEGYGLYIHNARENKVLQNTFYNNHIQIGLVKDDIAPNSYINNTEMRENIFFSLHPSQTVAEFKSNGNDIESFGTFDQNYYCRPFDDNATIGVLKRVNGTYSWQLTDLEGWQKMFGKDLASKTSPKTFPTYTITGVNSDNKFGNGSFNTNVGGLYAFAPANNCRTVWSGNGLDGGSLGVSFTSATSYSKGSVIIGVGAITAGKKYWLRFSMRGSNEQKMLEVYLRKSGAPYNDVAKRELVKVSDKRKEVALLFTASETTPDGSIGIDVPEHTSTVFFDNIDLKEVTATDVNFSDSVRLIHNATASTVSQNLTGSFVDTKVASYRGSISLAPYSSAVLMVSGSGGTVVVPPNPDPTPAPPAPVTCAATGTILREQWLNITGNDVVNIPLLQAPKLSDQLSSFELAPNKGDRYGTRIRGYLCPPQTGAYTFWISGDDATELWLSDSDNPSRKVKIAYNLSWTNFREWNKLTSQKSREIYLEAGKRYYIEALHKEGAGGDHLSVAWKLPSGQMEAPIAGSRLSPFRTEASLTFGNTINSSIDHERFQVMDPTGAIEIASLESFPNPFIDNAIVEVVPAASGFATIDVQDASGRVVQKLYSGVLQQGVKQRYQLKSSGLTSGVYLIRLTSQGKVAYYKTIKAN